MKKIRLATCWLDGCSGCHMSLLDIDDRLLAVTELADIVYGPLVDIKEFPAEVDVTLVEGACGSHEDVELLRKIRERTRVLVALGDCAVTSNVPSMRNPWGTAAILKRAYVENANVTTRIPDEVVPALLPRALPIHDVVKIDVHLPGCPPSADQIFHCVAELCAGRMPEVNPCKFG